jgi:hypothetical protein
MMRRATFAALALMTVAAATACGGTPLPTCSVPVQPAFDMVSPAPGATGVPDNLSEIVFAGFGPGSGVKLVAGAQTIALGTLEPAPTPTPTPQGALLEYIAAVPTPLSAATTYTVEYTYTVSGSNCAPFTSTPTLGSFTTQ